MKHIWLQVCVSVIEKHGLEELMVHTEQIAREERLLGYNALTNDDVSKF